MHTHSPAEWVAFLSLGLSISSAVSIPFWLFVDADLADFDPRPRLAHAIESGRFDRLLIAVTNARHVARCATAEALLVLLLLLNAPEGATR